MHLVVWTAIPSIRAPYIFRFLFHRKLWIPLVMNLCWDIRVMRPGYIRNTGDLEWLAGLALCFEPEPFFYALHRRFAKGGILQCGSITRVGVKADFEHHGWHTRSRSEAHTYELQSLMR